LTEPAVRVAAHAPAKLNLFLHVLGREEDGYHRLDSLVAFLTAGDRLWVEPAAELRLAIEGPFAAGLDAGEGNLIIRAARGLAALAGVTAGAAIRLEKNLPVASGIGGGSADAAATLRALRRLWAVTVPEPAVELLAQGLGADVPMCLLSRPALIGGIGERIEPVGLPADGAVLLVNPGAALSTAAVFGARKGTFDPPAAWTERPATMGDLAEALARRRNGLGDAAIGLLPDVAAVLEAIRATPRCLLARMSGSGATCFGLYSELEAASEARARIAAAHPGWWVQTARFLAPPGRAVPE